MEHCQEVVERPETTPTLIAEPSGAGIDPRVLTSTSKTPVLVPLAAFTPGVLGTEGALKAIGLFPIDLFRLQLLFF